MARMSFFSDCTECSPMHRFCNYLINVDRRLVCTVPREFPSPVESRGED